MHHVSLLTGNVPATIAFYRDQLGLRLVQNTVNQENHHMRHIFFGDDLGTPGTVITFFEVSNLGPRYDDGAFMHELHLAIPKTSADYWQHRLGSLHVKDPNDVAITLVPTNTLPKAAAVASLVPAAAQIQGLLGSVLSVPDRAAALHFFATMLHQPLYEPQVLLDHGERLTLEAASAGKHRFGRGSIDHIALTVPDQAALNGLQTLAQQAGFTVEKYADRGWFQSLYVLEPNGNRIEFATTTPGFALDGTVDQIGVGLGLPPFLEDQRQALVQYWANQGVLFDEPAVTPH
ncbi:VOC family protein [Lacticaseibacillus jixiensis]|uniref:VOC family protein n=1 Tax=Lacticaseibacillus jixiensis TaxID=3231926 RepID=UPI0036F37E15